MRPYSRSFNIFITVNKVGTLCEAHMLPELIAVFIIVEHYQKHFLYALFSESLHSAFHQHPADTLLTVFGNDGNMVKDTSSTVVTCKYSSDYPFAVHGNKACCGIAFKVSCEAFLTVVNRLVPSWFSHTLATPSQSFMVISLIFTTFSPLFQFMIHNAQFIIIHSV